MLQHSTGIHIILCATYNVPKWNMFTAMGSINNIQKWRKKQTVLNFNFNTLLTALCFYYYYFDSLPLAIVKCGVRDTLKIAPSCSRCSEE